MSPEDQKVSVNTLINFMLARDSEKLLTKRSDIIDLFKRSGGAAKKGLPIDKVIAEARLKFQHVFGFDLKEVTTDAISDDVSMSQSQSQRQAVQKAYLLINILKTPAEEGEAEGGDESPETKAKRQRAKLMALSSPSNSSPHFNLAMVLMAVIALKRYSVTEQELWDALRPLGLFKGTNHAVFGSPEKALKDLCDQGYLHSKKSKDKDNQTQVKC